MGVEGGEAKHSRFMFGDKNKTVGFMSQQMKTLPSRPHSFLFFPSVSFGVIACCEILEPEIPTNANATKIEGRETSRRQ